MEAPGDAVHLVLAHSERTAVGRVRADTGWNAAVAAEEQPADGVQCSRVEVAVVVGDGAAAEDPAACGGDDAA